MKIEKHKNQLHKTNFVAGAMCVW